MDERPDGPRDDGGSAKYWCMIIAAALELASVILQTAEQDDTSLIALATRLASWYLHVIML